MERLLQRLLTLTKDLAERGLDEGADTLDELLSLRDEVVEQLTAAPFVAEEQRHMLREITRYDELLLSMMSDSKNEAMNAIAKLNQSRTRKNIYEVSHDVGSYFIDKKK